MEKKNFLTQRFYEDPQITIDIFNKISEKKEELIADQDMYQSGEFLFLEIYENEETKKLLSEVISDLEAYKSYNNDGFASDDDTEIGLLGLQFLHAEFHPKHRIYWHEKSETFMSEDVFYSDDVYES